MSPHGLGVVPIRRGFPRVSGDEPAAALAAPTTIEFSPRERG